MRDRWRRILTALRQALRDISFRPFDYVIIIVAIGVIVVFSAFALDRSGQARAVEIRSDEGEFIYPLDEDRDLYIEGPLGESHIVIEDGTVRFEDSPCRDKICVAAGALGTSGEWAACLPNRVFISVIGTTDEDESGVDATAF
ncbi:MAG: NusG domain II-containing protein [Alkalispirochaeta sp.]